MATIKSYTDISQSKTLSNILPLESADMCYLSEESLIPKVIYNGMVFFDSKEERPTNIIYCWSLAALLELIPKEQHPELMINAHYKWICDISNPSSFTYKPAVGYNPLDACYEMILKLHELNLL